MRVRAPGGEVQTGFNGPDAGPDQHPPIFKTNHRVGGAQGSAAGKDLRSVPGRLPAVWDVCVYHSHFFCGPCLPSPHASPSGKALDT